MAYEYKKTLWKGFRRLLQYGVPLVLAYLIKFNPEITSLTVGSMLEGLINWVKHHKDN